MVYPQNNKDTAVTMEIDSDNVIKAINPSIEQSYSNYRGSSGYRKALSDIIIPKMELFQPDLLIISAGFDGFHSDPAGGELKLSLDDYDWSTKQVCSFF